MANPELQKKPPWDGGIVWARDKQGNPWISISLPGFGSKCLVSLQRLPGRRTRQR